MPRTTTKINNATTYSRNQEASMKAMGNLAAMVAIMIASSFSAPAAGSPAARSTEGPRDQTTSSFNAPWWMNEHRIIGTNNLEPIEATELNEQYEKTRILARVETHAGDGFCTASRVGPDLFLTNYHCYDFVPCDDVQFHMGYERDLPPKDQLIFQCEEVLAQDLSLDYALYRVSFTGNGPDNSGEERHAFEDLGLSIPDNDPEGVVQVLDIEQEGTLEDISVELQIHHTFISDLEVNLVSPQGRRVNLHRRSGGYGANLIKTFTMQQTALSAFAGIEVGGQWLVEVRDISEGDIGVLDKVVITIQSLTDEEPPVVVGALPDSQPIARLFAGPIIDNQMLLVASHPRGRLKMIDRGPDCKLKSVLPVVLGLRQTITHTCDTEGGSSGSPILDRETGHVVALHWGGSFTENYAIPMGLVVAHLKENIDSEYFAMLDVQY